MRIAACWMAWMTLAAAAADSTGVDLFDAIRRNDLAVLKTGLKKGADLNARDRRGATPLMHAAAFGSLDAMKLLIAAGADVNASNSFDATALVWAAGDPAKVRLLLDRGATANAVTKQRRTPLSAAAAYDSSAEVVRLLLAKGADSRAGDGAAALLAANARDPESLRLLLEKGAEHTVKDQFSFNPLLNAVSANNLAAVKLLLAAGADVNFSSNAAFKVPKGIIALSRLSPLMMAVPYGAPEMVRTLLDAGANVNVKDIRDMTPLMLAVASEKQDVEVVRMLLAKGADVHARSNVDETALDWAKKFNNSAVIGTLEQAGAKTGVPYAGPPRGAGAAPGDPRSAIEKSVALLQKTSTQFLREGGCVGCHHQNFTAMAVAAARSHGARLDEQTAAEQLKVVRSNWNAAQEILLQMIDPPGAFDTVVFSLVGLAAEKHPSDVITDSMVFYIAGQQRADGSWWLGGISRAPLEEGAIQRTALGIRALRLYPLAGRRGEFDRRVDKAREWLLNAEAKTNDDLAMLVAGLHWSGAPAARTRDAARRLLAAQRSDGGWSQNVNLSSDAFATGESLWALRQAGHLRPGDPAHLRGVQFLLTTQYADGSWYVRSRAPKFQPYFESGFPYGHDQWISASATAWATMALAAGPGG